MFIIFQRRRNQQGATGARAPPNILDGGAQICLCPPNILTLITTFWWNSVLFRYIVPKYHGLSLSFIEKPMASGDFAPLDPHINVGPMGFHMSEVPNASTRLIVPPQSCQSSYASVFTNESITYKNPSQPPR